MAEADLRASAARSTVGGTAVPPGCGAPPQSHPEPAVAAIRRQSGASSGRQDGALSMLAPLPQQQIEHVGRPRVAVRAARCGLVAGLRRVQQYAVVSAHDAVENTEAGEGTQQRGRVRVRGGVGVRVGVRVRVTWRRHAAAG